MMWGAALAQPSLKQEGCRRHPGDLPCHELRDGRFGVRIYPVRATGAEDSFLPMLRAHASEPAPVRERDLLAGDEFEQHGLPFRVHLPGALDGRGDLCGLLDALGIPAHRAAHVRITPADVARVVAVVRD